METQCFSHFDANHPVKTDILFPDWTEFPLRTQVRFRRLHFQNKIQSKVAFRVYVNKSWKSGSKGGNC